MKLDAIGMTYAKCTRFCLRDWAMLTETGIAGDRSLILLDKDGAPIAPGRHGLYLPLEVNISDDGATMTLSAHDGWRHHGPLDLGEEDTLDYMGLREIRVRPVLGNWNSIVSDFAGRKTQLVHAATPSGGVDIKPITLVTTASLAELSRRLGAPVDARRFRCNLVIDNGSGGAHAEDAWNGAELRIGAARLRVLGSVPRCVVTQLSPETGRNDLRTVPTLMEYRAKVRLPDGLMPDYATPGFCSYAEVIKPAPIAIGDRVDLL